MLFERALQSETLVAVRAVVGQGVDGLQVEVLVGLALERFLAPVTLEHVAFLFLLENLRLLLLADLLVLAFEPLGDHDLGAKLASEHLVAVVGVDLDKVSLQLVETVQHLGRVGAIVVQAEENSGGIFSQRQLDAELLLDLGVLGADLVVFLFFFVVDRHVKIQLGLDGELLPALGAAKLVRVLTLQLRMRLPVSGQLLLRVEPSAADFANVGRFRSRFGVEIEARDVRLRLEILLRAETLLDVRIEPFVVTELTETVSAIEDLLGDASDAVGPVVLVAVIVVVVVIDVFIVAVFFLVMVVVFDGFVVVGIVLHRCWVAAAVKEQFLNLVMQYPTGKLVAKALILKHNLMAWMWFAVCQPP